MCEHECMSGIYDGGCVYVSVRLCKFAIVFESAMCVPAYNHVCACVCVCMCMCVCVCVCVNGRACEK